MSAELALHDSAHVGGTAAGEMGSGGALQWRLLHHRYIRDASVIASKIYVSRDVVVMLKKK